MLKQYDGFPAGVFVATDVAEQLERMRRVVEETDKEKESIRHEAIHLKKALDSALKHNEELTIALMEADKEFASLDVPQIEQVVYSGPKTIIMWQDGTKTMVSPCDDQQRDDYAAFCAAVVKKMFGSTHKAKKFLESVRKDQVKKQKNKAPVQQVIEQFDEDWEGK